MNGVLGPYTLAIQHNVVMQYPDYFASVDARELEAQIILKTSIGRKKAVQEIDLHSEY